MFGKLDLVSNFWDNKTPNSNFDEIEEILVSAATLVEGLIRINIRNLNVILMIITHKVDED